jgi:hypothetical protein
MTAVTEVRQKNNMPGKGEDENKLRRNAWEDRALEHEKEFKEARTRADDHLGRF